MSGNRRTEDEQQEALDTAVDLLDLGAPAANGPLGHFFLPDSICKGVCLIS